MCISADLQNQTGLNLVNWERNCFYQFINVETLINTIIVKITWINIIKKRHETNNDNKKIIILLF